MVGKLPKIKPATDKAPDFNADGLGRLRHVDSPSVPHHRDPLLPSHRQHASEALEVISVIPSLMPSAIVGIEVFAAKSRFSDYWIPASITPDEGSAQEIRVFKQREYVAVDDAHFVQVVRDTESGLFRAKAAKELKASGPLLKPDSDGRYWHPMGVGEVLYASRNRMHGQTTELFRRMGYSVNEFSETTVARILAVSGNDETSAGDTDGRFWVNSLLYDTLRRFRLDQTMQRWALPDRAARFQAHERAFELDCDENTVQMRRFFADLPKSAAQALWRDASAADRLHMYNQPGMPQHMAIDALISLREFRIGRACEGLYLSVEPNPDSDRLALYMIGTLDGRHRCVSRSGKTCLTGRY